MTPINKIPGIGKVFQKDFARIGITHVEQLARQDPQTIFETLCEANNRVGHKTSKNYLYVIRMCVYYADGGRSPERLKWNAWKDL